jgi:hypothetical protein
MVRKLVLELLQHSRRHRGDPLDDLVGQFDMGFVVTSLLSISSSVVLKESSEILLCVKRAFHVAEEVKHILHLLLKVSNLGICVILLARVKLLAGVL